MAFEGLLVLPRPARIDGRVAGTVLAGASVWVGATGVVEADLEADAIVVEGSVHGDLRARTSIELGPGAVVTGDLTGPRVAVAEGAQRGRPLPGRAAASQRRRAAAAAS